MNNRIQNNPGLQYIATRSLNESATPPGQANRAQQTNADSAADRVSLSPRADKLNELLQIAQSAPDTNEKRIEALKNAISQGQYAVDTDQLAANMMGIDSALSPSKSE